MRFRVLLWRHGAALLAAALPCLAWLAPILRDPAHTVIGWEGDNLYYGRQFWWMKRALCQALGGPPSVAQRPFR